MAGAASVPGAAGPAEPSTGRDDDASPVETAENADAPEGDDPATTATTRDRLRAWGIVALKTGLVTAAAWYFTRIVRAVDWHLVWVSLLQLSVWQGLVLLAMAGVRQVLNAVPLAVFTPGLGIRRAVTNDLAANLVATFSPPPADIVLRLAMFRSWGVDTTRGLSGLTLNTVTYYVARFGAPLVGLVLLALTGRDRPGVAVTSSASTLIAVAVVVGLALVSHGEAAAARVGGAAGRLAHRVAPRRVDPDVWSARFVGFQHDSADALRRGAVPVTLDLVALLAWEGLILVASMRFVGVSAAEAPAVDVVAALLVCYPLTAAPLSGFGVLDAAVLAVLGEAAGAQRSQLVAGLVVWRLATLVVPWLMGAGALLVWRRTLGHATPPESAAATP